MCYILCLDGIFKYEDTNRDIEIGYNTQRSSHSLLLVASSEIKNERG